MDPGALRAPAGQPPAASGRQRLFVALPLPEPVRQSLAGAQARWGTDPPLPVRWAHPDGLHVTVLFLGDVEGERVPAVAAALAGASAGEGPFSLTLRGVGAFPHLDSPRVLWARVGGDVARLHALHLACAGALRGAGVPFDDRPDGGPFRPHVTLGRVAGGLSPMDARRLARVVAPLRDLTFGDWQATDLHLMRSLLAPGGATYATVSATPLGGAPVPAWSEGGGQRAEGCG